MSTYSTEDKIDFMRELDIQGRIMTLGVTTHKS